MAKPKFREIKIQRNGKFNTNGTVHETIEEAFAYCDKKLPNNTTTYLIYPKDLYSELGMKLGFEIACFSLGNAKQWLEDLTDKGEKWFFHK